MVLVGRSFFSAAGALVAGLEEVRGRTEEEHHELILSVNHSDLEGDSGLFTVYTACCRLPQTIYVKVFTVKKLTMKAKEKSNNSKRNCFLHAKPPTEY